MECRICGMSSKETLTVHANEDFTKWLYLCKQCHSRLIARIGVGRISKRREKEKIIGCLLKDGWISAEQLALYLDVDKKTLKEAHQKTWNFKGCYCGRV